MGRRGEAPSWRHRGEQERSRSGDQSRGRVLRRYMPKETVNSIYFNVSPGLKLLSLFSVTPQHPPASHGQHGGVRERVQCPAGLGAGAENGRVKGIKASQGLTRTAEMGSW